MLCGVTGLFWQSCLPCPPLAGAQSRAEQLLWSGWALLPAAGAQWGELQDAWTWDQPPLWLCGRNGAGRAQQSWHRLGG